MSAGEQEARPAKRPPELHLAMRPPPPATYQRKQSDWFGNVTPVGQVFIALAVIVALLMLVFVASLATYVAGSGGRP